MAQQYEEFIKKIVEAAEKNGGVQNWYTFQTTAGASGGQYGIVLPHDNWAAKDEWINPMAVLTEAFGEDAGKGMAIGASSRPRLVTIQAQKWTNGPRSPTTCPPPTPKRRLTPSWKK